jgi:hypothetical protein
LKLNGFVLDIESDGFYFEATKIWCIHFVDLDTDEKFSINPFEDDGAFEKFQSWVDRYENPIVAFHNGLGFDAFLLRALLGIDFTVGPDTILGKPCRYVDTFYWSMFLMPDRVGHGIEAWGERLGLSKIDWRTEAVELGLIERSSPKGSEFMQWHAQMGVYCERDVAVNKMVFMSLLDEHLKFYKWEDNAMPSHFRCGQKSFFLMSCQEYAGWKFDIPKAQALKDRITVMMEEIRAEVEPKLPPRKLKKSEEKNYTMPAKPYKQSGDFSSSWLKFVEKHSGVLNQSNGLWEFYGKEYPITAGMMLEIRLPMEMANQDQMKDWFLEQKWSPTLWNYQRGADGKPMRDPTTRKLIPTSPKIQEAGKICPNLMKLEGDIVKQVVKWLSLRNRLSVLEGWLSNERLQYDGRLGAGRTGIAATHRQKHKNIVNVPKASEKVLLGKEFRELFCSESGYKIAAGDAAALEGRVQGSYTFKYDNGATAEELLRGDPHSKNAMAFFGHLSELKAFDISSPDFNKDDPVFKPYRDRSKNGFYAILYGAAGPKVASTLGLPEKMGQSLMEKFWDANPGTKELKDKLEKYWETKGESKYLPAIDGRILWTRKKSALLNTIFQSCGGIAMDYACCFLDSWLGKIHWDEKRRPYYLYKGCIVRRIGYVHDEVEFECEEPVAEDVGRLIEKAIEKAGQFLKIQVPLAGEAKVGLNWKETH